MLAADTGGPTSGLARIADATAPLTLCDIAERVTAGEPLPTPLWAHGEHQLRVIAGVPQFTVDAPQETVLRVLGDARHAHGLTIVDVGTLARRAEQAALAAATHVAWTLVANSDALAAARRVLERIVPLSRPELIVARTDPAGAKPPIRELCELAEQRRAPLVLMPTFSDTAAAAAAGGGGVCEASSDELAERAQVALQAIAGVLRR